jgi:hypothetical protein
MLTLFLSVPEIHLSMTFCLGFILYNLLLFWWVCLYMWPIFSLLQHSEFFLCSVYWVFWLYVRGVSFLFLKVSCSVSLLNLDVPPFLKGQFSAIMLLNKISMLLLCFSSQTSIPWFIDLVFWWYPRFLACSIHIFLAFFHGLWLFDVISLCFLLFLILYFQLAPLCLPSF